MQFGPQEMDLKHFHRFQIKYVFCDFIKDALLWPASYPAWNGGRGGSGLAWRGEGFMRARSRCCMAGREASNRRTCVWRVVFALSFEKAAELRIASPHDTMDACKWARWLHT